jgi:hypothetical protein
VDLKIDGYDAAGRFIGVLEMLVSFWLLVSGRVENNTMWIR